MPSLALKGGRPVRERPFPAYVTIGEEEKKAVLEVMESTVLSRFIGQWSEDFFGGPKVQQLERDWEAYFHVRHAVSMNSATSGLYAAVGAAGVGPGDEVIVSPYTMVASATAPLIYGAIPVFADIDPDVFTITPVSIRRCITSRTRAIIAVDLFGHPADMDGIMEIAREHDLVVIEDAAQAPGAKLRSRYAGTLAHMGVFSLNYHKTIHCGEGGMVVTDIDTYAERLQLIRNHAEAVVRAKGVTDLVNMVGYNYRMTELEAAIAAQQLRKLEGLLLPRIRAAEYLSRGLGEFPFLIPPLVRPGVRHAYYVHAMKYDPGQFHGVDRDRFVAAIKAEGIPLVPGYVEPIYLAPLYQRQIAIGKEGFPFTNPGYRGTVNYRKGICPVTERMYGKELMYTNVCHAIVTTNDLDDVLTAFDKVSHHWKELT